MRMSQLLRGFFAVRGGRPLRARNGKPRSEAPFHRRFRRERCRVAPRIRPSIVAIRSVRDNECCAANADNPRREVRDTPGPRRELEAGPRAPRPAPGPHRFAARGRQGDATGLPSPLPPTPLFSILRSPLFPPPLSRSLLMPFPPYCGVSVRRPWACRVAPSPPWSRPCRLYAGSVQACAGSLHSVSRGCSGPFRRCAGCAGFWCSPYMRREKIKKDGTVFSFFFSSRIGESLHTLHSSLRNKVQPSQKCCAGLFFEPA